MILESRINCGGFGDFIAQDNLDAASRVIDTAYATFKTPAANPGLGRLRQFRSPRLRDVRSWRISGFESYLIFYRGVADGIQINHVYHGARDMDGLFDEN